MARYRLAAEAAMLGLLFPASIVAGYLLGAGFDRLAGTAWAGRAVGFFLGVVAAFWNLVQFARRASRDGDE